MSQPKVGIQPIIYGQRPQTDLQGIVAECKTVGYAGVEGGSYVHLYGLATVKELFARHEITFTGVHTGYGDFTDEAKLHANLAFVKGMGARYLICSGVADTKTVAGYEQSAETFNRVGTLCQEEGVTFCYHNHAFEFDALPDGTKGIHRLADQTDTTLVKFNIDVYWVTVGGEDPVAFIRRYTDRGGYFHFKDGAPGSFTELGRGTVDLKGSLAAAIEVGADWIVYEQDRTAQEPLTSITESRAYLRTIGL